MTREVVVSSIGFGEAGVEVTYLVLPDDVRWEGHVVSSRNTSVSYQAPDGFGTRVDELRRTITELVTELHDAIPAMPVHDPAPTRARNALRAALDDEDDDEGMGDG